MSNFPTEEILRRYPQCLRPNIKEAVTNGIGLTQSFIQITLPPNKLTEDYEIDHGNSVILTIPYVGKQLQWEIIFNDEDLTFPPDFDILNDTFLDDPDITLIDTNLSTLCSWNIENPASLVTFIKELFDFYKTYQMTKFLNDPKCCLLREEFEQLKKQLKLDGSEVEVFTENNKHCFLISLSFDYSHLPVYIQKNYFPDGIVTNPGADRALLKISIFQNRRVPNLKLSARLDDIFSTYTPFHLPLCSNNISLAEYVQSVKTLVKEKLDYIREHFKKKEDYIAVLLSLHGDNVREYDNTGFSKATFLFEVGAFACLGQIFLSERFPHDAPLVTLRSLYHKNSSGTPALLVLKSYPYNPNWKIEEMVDRLLMHIRNEMTKFKTHCVNNLS